MDPCTKETCSDIDDVVEPPLDSISVTHHGILNVSIYGKDPNVHEFKPLEKMDTKTDDDEAIKKPDQEMTNVTVLSTMKKNKSC